MNRLADRYEMRRVIGRGGLGEVWEARDAVSGREVAVKTAERAKADRLRREAALISRVDHPGVVDVLDAGEDGATVFYVMDLLRGRDLSEVLQEGPLPAREALRVTAVLADILDATHRAGIVHGDVKPANVVLSGEDVMLVDFGAAATPDDGPRRETVGTVPYMAPEQVTGGPLTPATDLYSLGCLLVSTLAGRPPFVSASPAQVLQWQARAEPPRLHELLRGAPARLDELVATLLHKDPAARGSAADVRDSLVELGAHPALDRVAPRHSAPPVRVDPQATLPALSLLRTTTLHDVDVRPEVRTGGCTPVRHGARRTVRPDPGRRQMGEHASRP